jgi:membrane-associated protease RseP (regulator of RpoE activity)
MDKTNKGVLRRRETTTAITLLVAIMAIASIVSLYLSGTGIFVEWGMAIIILAIAGMIISKINGFNGSFGLYLLGSRHGTGFVDWLAGRKDNFWEVMADWGLAAGFGMLSYFLFKGKISKRMIAIGIISDLVILYLAVPALFFSLKFINIPQISSRLGSIPISATPSEFFGLVLDYATSAFSILGAVFILIGGYSMFSVGFLAFGALEILYGISSFIFISITTAKPNYAILSSQIPGASPVIPGITIPLISGIIALVIILVAHEFSHGVLSRRAKVKLKSIGVVLFGIIPMGAFVEPDEKQVTKLPAIKQNRIFIAGVSSNLILSAVFLVLTVLMLLYVMPIVTTNRIVVSGVIPNTPANGIIRSGTVIYSWDNHTVGNITSLENAAAGDGPFSLVSLSTNLGNYSIRANQSGKIGVYLSSETVPISNSRGYEAIYFIYQLFALSFMLNFFVGIFNLLPAPFFDAWRIYGINVKNKNLIKYLSAIVIVSIILNILPWLWTV